MAQSDEDEMKIFAHIRAMEEGDLKNKLLETFMQQTSSSSRANKKPIFPEASYYRNTKAYQRDHKKSKVRPLTLGEVSREIHMLKSEISALKSQVK